MGRRTPLERLKRTREGLTGGNVIAISLDDFDLLVSVYEAALGLPKLGMVPEYWRWIDEIRAALKGKSGGKG